MREDAIIVSHDVVKVCRACQSRIVDGAAVCACCGLQQLTVPAAPTKLDRVWHFSAICVAVLGVVSASLAVGVVRRQSSPFHRNPQKLSVQSDRNIVYRRSVVLSEEVRKVYAY